MLTPDDLMQAAVTETGLEHFGDDGFREGLERLCGSLRSEAELTEIGEQILGYRIRRLLENRLRIEDVYRRHPEIGDERAEAPIFIIGLPRTGTTALSNLLACDPRIRPLRMWESNEPVPPPEERTQHTDARIARTQRMLDAMYAAYPEMRYLYPQAATGPTECQDLLGMSFRALHFDGMAHVPSYISWVTGCDMAPAYDDHRRTLKLLQWRCPPRLWHLKTPVHTLSLDALDGAYPDARFIWTHRDPTRVLGSVCSLIAYLHRMVSDRDPAGLGAAQLDLWAEAVRRGVAFRDRAGEHRFADVRFDDLGADPIGTVARAYDRLGLTLDAPAERAMRAWVDANPRGGRGTHEYTLVDAGLDADEVRARFGAYRARFGLDDPSPSISTG